jgi:ribosome biogenesis GTPase
VAALKYCEVRGSDGRGRHTTTHRELHIAASGAMVIDTPGLRQVGLVDDVDLNSAFTDIEELAAHCRFSDCQHETEPGCAILNALEEGVLNAERWQNFLKLQKELLFERRKSNKALQSEQKKKWVKIHVANRERQKMRGR